MASLCERRVNTSLRGMLLRRVVEVFRGEEGADDSSDDSSQGITGGDGRFGADQSTRAAAGEATEEKADGGAEGGAQPLQQ